MRGLVAVERTANGQEPGNAVVLAGDTYVESLSRRATYRSLFPDKGTLCRPPSLWEEHERRRTASRLSISQHRSEHGFPESYMVCLCR